MGIDDDFPDDNDGDKTLLRPRPGGRRAAGPTPPPAPGSPGAAPPQAPPPQGQIPPAGMPQQPVPPAQMQQQMPPPAPAAVPSLDSIRGAGSSALATAAAPLLVLISQIRGLPTHADVNGLHQQVIIQVQKFEADANAAGVAPEQIQCARLV